MPKDKTRKRKFSKKTIFGMLVSAILLAIIAWMIVGLKNEEPISEDFFVSDDTKVVMQLKSEFSSIGAEWKPEAIYYVYFRDGDKIDSAKIYYKYENEELAKEAFPNIPPAENLVVKMNRNYIIINVSLNKENDLTVERIEKVIDDMRAAGAAI